MGRFGRDLKTVTWLDCAGRLTLYGKLEAAFQDIGGFDPRMRVSGDGHARLYGRFHEQRRIARRRTVRLRQNLSRDPGSRLGWQGEARTRGPRILVAARLRLRGSVLTRDAKAARASDLRSQPTTSAACWLWPSLMPRAFIQS